MELYLIFLDQTFDELFASLLGSIVQMDKTKYSQSKFKEIRRYIDNNAITNEHFESILKNDLNNKKPKLKLNNVESNDIDNLNDVKNVKTKQTKHANQIQSKRQGVKKPRILKTKDESGAEDSNKEESI